MLIKKQTNNEPQLSWIAKQFPVFYFNWKRIWKSIPLWVLNATFGLLILIFSILLSNSLNIDYENEWWPEQSIWGYQTIRIFFILMYISLWIMLASYEIMIKQKKSLMFQLETRTGNKISNSYWSRFLILLLTILINVTCLMLIELIISLSFNDFNTIFKQSFSISTYPFIYLYLFIFIGLTMLMVVSFNPVVSTIILMFFLTFVEINPLCWMPMYNLSLYNKKTDLVDANERLKSMNFQFNLFIKYEDYFKENPELIFFQKDLSKIEDKYLSRVFNTGIFEEDYDEIFWIKDSEYFETKSYTVFKNWKDLLKNNNYQEMSISKMTKILISLEKDEKIKDFLRFNDEIINQVLISQLLIRGNILNEEIKPNYSISEYVVLVLNSLRYSMQLDGKNLLTEDVFKEIVQHNNTFNRWNPIGQIEWLKRGKTYSKNNVAYFEAKIPLVHGVSLTMLNYEWKIIDQNRLDQINNYDSRTVPEVSELKTIIEVGKLKNNNNLWELIYFLYLAVSAVINAIAFLIFKKINTI